MTAESTAERIFQELNQLRLTGWYPGHMLKAGRKIQERLKLVDFVVELLDARIPMTSRNPAFNNILGEKPRFLVFNKCDLASRESISKWESWFASCGENCMFVDSLHGTNVQKLPDAMNVFMKSLRKERGAKSPMFRPIRVMISGIPNIGKSTLVNRLVATKRAATGPRPGVTRNQQWIKLKSNIELLDTPGVLWPKIGNKITELKLALTGAVKDDLVGEELVAEYLWLVLVDRDDVNWGRYNLAGKPETPEELIEAAGRRRGCLKAGGVIDRIAASKILIKDYRDGHLGTFCFEDPEDVE